MLETMHFNVPYNILGLGVGAPLDRVAEAYCHKLAKLNCLSCKRVVDLAYLMISNNGQSSSNSSSLLNSFNNSKNLNLKQRSVEFNLELNLDEIYARETIFIQYERYETCLECNGMRPLTWDRTNCKIADLLRQYNECSNCCRGPPPIDVNDIACRGCSDQGMRLVPATYALDLRRHSVLEKNITVSGEGHRIGGDPTQWGDLYIRTTIKPHPTVRRRGWNLYTEMDINVTQFLCGQYALLPFLNHTTLKIPCPPGGVAQWQPNRWFMVKGKGLASPIDPNGRGDLHIKFRLTFPDTQWFATLDRDRFQAIASAIFSQRTPPAMSPAAHLVSSSLQLSRKRGPVSDPSIDIKYPKFY